MINKVHFWRNKTNSIWDKIIDTILSAVSNRIKERELKLNLEIHQLSNEHEKPSSDHTNIVLCPLFELENSQLIPKGLKSLRNELYKNSNFNFNTIFLVANESDKPDPFRPHRDITYYAKSLIRNPNFGGMGKALLMLELILKQKEVINVVDIYNKKLSDDILQAILAIKEISQFKGYYRWRARFYEIFVGFYDDFQNASKIHIDLNAPKDLMNEAFITKGKQKITWENLHQTNNFYDHLKGTSNQEQSAHSVPLELFRAPIPFPLQELVDAKNEISEKLKKGGKDKKIKLLLIDNRSDNKFIVKNDTDNTPKAESLCDLLFSKDNGFGLCDIFEIQMLGNAVYKKKNGMSGFYEKYEKDIPLNDHSHFKGEYEEFKFKRFKEPESLKEPEKEYHKKFIRGKNNIRIETYLDLVYQKVKDAHFVLLDFFLDDDDTYLAFNFINDLCAMKKERNDTFTTWFFITSAVYDSVVKYSQSGLLAEYYESAVVSAGDDPTNEKRQIIFLYKLLTFINARFANFERYKDSIHEKLFADWDNDEACNESQLCCKIYMNNKSECGKEDCLQKLQSDIKRYLTEYDDVCSIFYDKKDNNDLKDIIELLDNVIKQFIWLPEADWYMIQHQIDFINNKLNSLQDKSLKKCKFSCKYIIEELKDRSDVY
ncbi:MAG: hypothetical protein KJ550_03865 [Proteobacteria bacterium]|nr:hypothetical protein [Pseudomonadota bacterium]MBU4068299.1 hypothetical protein [Pseudomonadota bacterium]